MSTIDDTSTLQDTTLKSVYTSENEYTVLQLLNDLIERYDNNSVKDVTLSTSSNTLSVTTTYGDNTTKINTIDVSNMLTDDQKTWLENTIGQITYDSATSTLTVGSTSLACKTLKANNISCTGTISGSGAGNFKTLSLTSTASISGMITCNGLRSNDDILIYGDSHYLRGDVIADKIITNYISPLVIKDQYIGNDAIYFNGDKDTATSYIRVVQPLHAYEDPIYANSIIMTDNTGSTDTGHAIQWSKDTLLVEGHSTNLYKHHFIFTTGTPATVGFARLIFDIYNHSSEKIVDNTDITSTTKLVGYGHICASGFLINSNNIPCYIINASFTKTVGTSGFRCITAYFDNETFKYANTGIEYTNAAEIVTSIDAQY